MLLPDSASGNPTGFAVTASRLLAPRRMMGQAHV
jgi:hypothetical protein